MLPSSPNWAWFSLPRSSMARRPRRTGYIILPDFRHLVSLLFLPHRKHGAFRGADNLLSHASRQHLR